VRIRAAKQPPQVGEPATDLARRNVAPGPKGKEAPGGGLNSALVR